MPQVAKRSAAVRLGAQQRGIVDQWVNAPNTLRASQLAMQDPAKAHLHGADDPTYLKESGDRTAAAIGAALFGVSLVMIGRGMWNMAHGTNKLK